MDLSATLELTAFVSPWQRFCFKHDSSRIVRMGSAAGRLLAEVPSDAIVSFLDNWSIATTAESDANDIANIADADSAFCNPSRSHVIIIEYGGWCDDVIVWREPAARNVYRR